MIAAAPKCGAAATIPAYLYVTHPSTIPSTASIVAIVAAALQSFRDTKIAEISPKVKFLPPIHWTNPAAKVLSSTGMPKPAAIVVGLRRKTKPVVRRKPVTP